MHRQPALAAVLVAKLIIAYAIARVEISAYGAGTWGRTRGMQDADADVAVGIDVGMPWYDLGTTVW